MPKQREIPLREALLCLASAGSKHTCLIILREGARCRHLCSLNAELASFSSSKLARKTLERTLNLPVRVLQNPEGAQLGLQTLLAKRSGPGFYTLGEPFRSLPASGTL